MSEREIIKIAVTPEAKAAIETAGERYGMSQIELASRAYTWFSEQDEVVQTAILGLLPDELAPDVARLALRRIAESETVSVSGRKKKAAKPARKRVHVTPKPSDPSSPGGGGSSEDSSGGGSGGGGTRPRKSGRRSK